MKSKYEGGEVKKKKSPCNIFKFTYNKYADICTTSA